MTLMSRISEVKVFAGKTAKAWWLSAGAALLCMALAACSTPKGPAQDEQIKQNAADATRQLKQDSKTVGKELKKDAHEAARVLDDTAAGVKEGLKSPTGDHTVDIAAKVNINTATARELTMLPGVTARRANGIIRNRPYDQSEDLVSKGVLDRTEYERISDRVYAR